MKQSLSKQQSPDYFLSHQNSLSTEVSTSNSSKTHNSIGESVEEFLLSSEREAWLERRKKTTDIHPIVMEKLLKLLVIDDDQIARTAVRQTLQLAGVEMELMEAKDSESAIALLKKQHFDCVFLADTLPSSDSINIIESIRAVARNIPLIVLTEQEDHRAADELINAGATDYIFKSKLLPEVISCSLRNSIRLHQAQRQAQIVNQQLQESQERYSLVLEGAFDAIWDWDIVTNQINGNDRFYEITGWSASDQPYTYETFLNKLHPDDVHQVKSKLLAHLHRHEEYNLELRIQNVSGEYRHCIARGKAQRDAYGRPYRMAGIISDITQRKQAEEQERFLADASILLAASLDYQKILASLARLAVPYIADLCVIDIIENKTVYRAEAVHHDPAKQELVKQLQDCYPPDFEQPNPIIKVLRTGQAELCPQITDELLVNSSHDSEHLQILRELGCKSHMIVPLVVRGRIFGAITFVLTGSTRRYSATDLALAEDLARRAALALENGKAHQEAREASENLRQAIMILGEQQQQLRTLQQLTNLLNQRLSDLPGLLRVMVKTVCEAVPGAQFCFIVLNNPQCNGLVLSVTAGIGTDKLQLEHAFAPKAGWLSEVFWAGKPQLIQKGRTILEVLPSSLPYTQVQTETVTIEDTPIQPPPASPNQQDFPAVIYAVPIESSQAGCLGVLAIGNWEDSFAFDDEDKHLMAAVGEQAAIAINNARMIKALEEREGRLELQNEILAEQNQELEKQRQQIQLQNLQLLEASRLKSQFLATMSHELRTPMNAVIGFSQVLLRQRQNHLTPQQSDMVERILNNGKHLLTLINDILDLSKIETGRLELKLEKFNLTQLITNVTNDLRPLAEQKNLSLTLDINLQNHCVIGDRARLRQVFANILSNAIKFTDAGSVEIELWEESSNQLVLTVTDTGIGISSEQLKHIFEQFRQVDQSLNRKYEGTGLGLALTQSLIQLMNGKISVESEIDRGSTFRIEFPRKLGDSKDYRLT